GTVPFSSAAASARMLLFSSSLTSRNARLSGGGIFLRAFVELIARVDAERQRKTGMLKVLLTTPRTTRYKGATFCGSSSCCVGSGSRRRKAPGAEQAGVGSRDCLAAPPNGGPETWRIGHGGNEDSGGTAGQGRRYAGGQGLDVRCPHRNRRA